MPARRYFLWGEPSSACRWDLRRTCGGVRARRPTDGMTTCANPARAIGDTAPYKIFRRGRCPHRPVRRPCAAHRTPCFVSLRASAHTGVAIRIPLRCAASARRCRPRLPFFLRRKKGRKERRQNQGFGILSAAEVPPASVPFSHATAALCKFLALLSHSLCISIRDALCACAG